MIRAIECCFCRLKSSDELKDRINFHLNQGFKDIDFIYRLIKTKVFDKSYIIQDVYPELLESFICYLQRIK